MSRSVRIASRLCKTNRTTQTDTRTVSKHADHRTVVAMFAGRSSNEQFLKGDLYQIQATPVSDFTDIIRPLSKTPSTTSTYPLKQAVFCFVWPSHQLEYQELVCVMPR